MTNCALTPAPDICPGHDDVLHQLIALLPRGRAWRTEQGGVRYGFLSALARVFAFAEQRICAAMEEFFCATAAETLDIWNKEYGVDDGCDPSPNLCAKVRAYDDPRCEFWVSSAARAGWALVSCVAEPGESAATADCARADTALAGGGLVAAQVYFAISASLSPALTGALQRPPLADRMLADDRLACSPDLTGLTCLLARIMPAHVSVILEVVA